MKSIELKSGTPKYQQLADYFLQEIRSGRINAGDCLPSLAELRAELGISQATFDKAHRLLEEEGLVSRERGRGSFVLDVGLASTQKRQTNVIAYFQPHSDVFQQQAYFGQLLLGIREAADRVHKNVLLVSQPEAFQDWDAIDGALYCLDIAEADNIIPAHPPDFPTVAPLYPIPGFLCIQADEATGQTEATRHLLELGHRRIAYLGQIHKVGLAPRLNGYRAALAQAGIELHPDWLFNTQIPDNYYRQERTMVETGRLNMARWLQNGWQETGCTAILTQNDLTAIGVIQALTEAGLRVPQDVSVIGFDGVERYGISPIALTTVKVPLKEIGERTVENLLEYPVANLDTIQLPCQLVIGESTASPSI
jgi:DNA-binding LacI/PurR family transcriptional regulator